MLHNGHFYVLENIYLCTKVNEIVLPVSEHLQRVAVNLNTKTCRFGGFSDLINDMI